MPRARAGGALARLAGGIALAPATFTAAYRRDGRGPGPGTYPNTPAGSAAPADRLDTGRRDGQALQLVLEPTAGYALAPAGFAGRRGRPVGLPHPQQVREWAKGRGRRATSDPPDAVLLARHGAERPPPAWRPPAAEISERASPLRRKDDAARMLRQGRNRRHARVGRPNVAGAAPDATNRGRAALGEAWRAIEQALAAHLRAHPALPEDGKRPRSVPGGGAKSGPYLLVLPRRRATLTEGAGTEEGLAAYRGLAPQPYQSGTSVRRRAVIARRGAQAVRRRPSLGAPGGGRGTKPLRASSPRLVGRGTPTLAALVAAARKLLPWAGAVFRRQTVFAPTRSLPAPRTPDPAARASAGPAAVAA